MRCGWMRPSSTSASSAIRATSRRTGSKQDSSTASGVSSMMRLTPVTDSNARMLRPSRPMMRPFMSSLGRCRTETTDSVVCSVASRWIAVGDDLAGPGLALLLRAAPRCRVRRARRRAWPGSRSSPPARPWPRPRSGRRCARGRAGAPARGRRARPGCWPGRRAGQPSSRARSSRWRASVSSRLSRSATRCSRRSRSRRRSAGSSRRRRTTNATTSTTTTSTRAPTRLDKHVRRHGRLQPVGGLALRAATRPRGRVSSGRAAPRTSCSQAGRFAGSGFVSVDLSGPAGAGLTLSLRRL